MHIFHLSGFSNPNGRFLTTQPSNLFASFKFMPAPQKDGSTIRNLWSGYKHCLVHCVMCISVYMMYSHCWLARSTQGTTGSDTQPESSIMMTRNYSTQCPSHDMHGWSLFIKITTCQNYLLCHTHPHSSLACELTML